MGARKTSGRIRAARQIRDDLSSILTQIDEAGLDLVAIHVSSAIDALNALESDDED